MTVWCLRCSAHLPFPACPDPPTRPAGPPSRLAWTRRNGTEIFLDDGLIHSVDDHSAMEISFRNLFQDFNPSKFVVYSCLLLFSLLFGLKLDGTIDAHYVIILIPLWIWKITALSGGITGCVVHWNHPPGRNDASGEMDYRSMVLSMGQHLLLLLFEILVCYKLDIGDGILWLFVFVPLLFLSLISIVVCVWSVRRERAFEFELFFSVNVLQFVFLPLKLDGYIIWSWVIVFVPMWILICLSLIGVLYAIVLAVLLIRSNDLLPEHRRQHVYMAIGYTFLVVPILIFMILLTNKLDGESTLPFVIVFSPLYISLLCLLFMACGSKGGNQWWFGIRRDFCQFLLEFCPVLRQYGNVTYSFSERNASQERTTERLSPRTNSTLRDVKPVVPIVSIECPD